MGGSKNIFKTFLIVGSSSALDQYFSVSFCRSIDATSPGHSRVVAGLSFTICFLKS